MTNYLFERLRQLVVPKGVTWYGLIIFMTIECLPGIGGSSHAKERVGGSVASKDWRMHVRGLLIPRSREKRGWYQFSVTPKDHGANCRVSVCLNKSSGSGLGRAAPVEGLAVVARITIETQVSPGPSEIVETRSEVPPPKEAILSRSFNGMRALFNRRGMTCVVIRRTGDKFFLSRSYTSDEECVRASMINADRKDYFKDIEGLVMRSFRELRTKECPDIKDQDILRVTVSSLPGKEGRGFRVEINASPVECRVVTKRSRPSTTAIRVVSDILDESGKTALKDLVGKVVVKGRNEPETLYLLAGLPKRLDDLRGLEIFSSLPEPLSNLFLARRSQTSVQQDPGQSLFAGCVETGKVWESIPPGAGGECLVLEPISR